MTVHFIGAGPGDHELLTLKAYKIISRCPICLYAGSLVSKSILNFCPKDVKMVNTAKLDLNSIADEFKTAAKNNQDIARLHSGDLSIWSALGEQIRILKKEKLKYTITPGIPIFSVASAILQNELTLPEVSQTLILTRTSGNASKMPLDENLTNIARTRATLVFYLSITKIKEIVDTIVPYYGKNCPIVILYKLTWPDQKIIKGKLYNIINKIPKNIDRMSLIIVGKVLYNKNFRNSSLYSSTYETRFKKIIKN